MHLDNAIGLNAAVALNTVYFCLSKGMGFQVASLIIGLSKGIDFAGVIRKMLGE